MKGEVPMRRMLFLAVAGVVTLALSATTAATAKEGGVCRLLGQWHTTEARVVQGTYVSGDITFIPLPEEKRGQFRLRQYASATPQEQGGVPEHRTTLMYGSYVELADGTTLEMQGVEHNQTFAVVILATEPEQAAFPQFLTLKGLWSSDRNEPVRLERDMFPPRIADMPDNPIEAEAGTVINFNACVAAHKRQP
jgi:hypothetical protein